MKKKLNKLLNKTILNDIFIMEWSFLLDFLSLFTPILR